VRSGKAFRFVVEAPDETAARAQIGALCERLLTNPVIEHSNIHLAEVVP
jgi:phosphoribosylformylglycinamidine synthase